MIDEKIITQWGSAFFELVLETKDVKKYLNESISLIDLFTQYPQILDILYSYTLAFSEKEKIITETFKPFSQYMVNLLLLLAQKNHFRYIRLVLKEFRKQCNNYFDIQYGTVYSVIPLAPQQMLKIQKNIRAYINNANVELVNKIDETLIGGVKVKVKNEVFDGSIKGQIEQLKVSLLKNSKEE